MTDPDSRVLKVRSGYVQGYNAQAAVNEEQVVLAAEVTVSSADFGYLEPMLDATQTELERTGVDQLPDVLLADAGYWHQQQMENIVNRGIQVLVAPDSKKRNDTRPGWDRGLSAFMRRALASERGGELYRKRQALAEPVFAQMKFNRGLGRLRRRGRSAARCEWRLITATHDLLKLHQHQMAPARA